VQKDRCCWQSTDYTDLVTPDTSIDSRVVGLHHNVSHSDHITYSNRKTLNRLCAEDILL